MSTRKRLDYIVASKVKFPGANGLFEPVQVFDLIFIQQSIGSHASYTSKASGKTRCPKQLTRILSTQKLCSKSWSRSFPSTKANLSLQSSSPTLFSRSGNWIGVRWGTCGLHFTTAMTLKQFSQTSSARKPGKFLCDPKRHLSAWKA